jgi:hypothetical protein
LPLQRNLLKQEHLSSQLLCGYVGVEEARNAIDVDEEPIVLGRLARFAAARSIRATPKFYVDTYPVVSYMTFFHDVDVQHGRG